MNTSSSPPRNRVMKVSTIGRARTSAHSVGTSSGSTPGMRKLCRLKSWDIFRLHALLQTGLDEIVQITVEHCLRIPAFEVGAQILDTALVEHVRADLVAPADVALRVLEFLLLGLTLAQ